ncbi:angiopoietin-1 receptor-like isoform X4 [Camponotus floridanus]|uniref:angiopoietin-1 receptor-like isoform X4 n=1 Tax=Camponotus floridanus TaxID=104421 RepID=UPI000DC66B9F|nr:angiopoietin-1 receptor-like isoform X4 [Camponotus floridanus]
MQIMFGTILCVLLKDLILTKAIITFIPKDYTPSNSLQEENVSICPNLNFTQDISIFEKSDHHILNFKSDRSHSDSTVRNKREDDEVTNTNVSIIPESIESSLSKPTSLRAFVQFNSQFAEKVNDIFVTLRWNQPEFINEIIQGYTVQCFFIEDLKEIQTCDDKNIITTKLEHTVHNLISNTIYYFRVRAHTKIVAGPYTDLINVSTTHENSIPKLLVITKHDMVILDVDSSITNVVMSESVIEYSSSFSRSATYVAYSIQERRIYWITGSDLMTLKINENNITKIASFDYYPHDLCIDWVGRNLYIAYRKLDYSYIVSFDLTMWENGIIKFDEIFKSKMNILRLSVSMGILYSLHNSTNGVFYMTQYPIDRKNIQIQINASVCLFHYSEYNFRDMIIDNMNNEESLIYWLNNWDIVVTDVNISMCNGILHNTEGVVKSGCKEYNLPTIIYTISVSCLDNNLNKSEKFEVLTAERYYEIQNLTPFTEYKLKYTLSNFYFDQLSINPFDSNVISMKTNSGKLNAPENVSALALKPTIAVVHWMPLKKVNCVAATYEVHWKSVTLANGTQQKGKQFINMPKRTADGRFFTKIHLSLPIQDYLIYVRVYPNNFSDFYNESLSKIDHIYSDPNNITLSEVEINSMDISWISNINLTISPTLEYKENATEKWQTTNYIKINYNKEIIYHIENLQSGTLYKFRLILRYPEYEENFIWPADERFIFSTLDISGTPGIIAKKYYLILMLGFIVIVTIICVCYFYRLHRERRYNNEQFLSSTDMELAILDEVSCQYTEFNTIYSPMLHCNPDECAITKIARKQITFTKLLGSGAFGMVFQGKVKNLEGSSTEISVAIKTLRKDASSREKKNLLKEAKLMNHFRHKHILRLLAVCLDGDSPLLVLELMETGDLLKYLRDCRNLQASDSPALRLQDLLAMCEDVARGCCYLEELRFVHRDLACRNCLVSSKNRENRVIKIGDFGLARDIYKGDYYRVKGQGLLPIRWMAPESLMIRIFTSQSDVWSFGVLMWEITSLGEQPYIAKTDEEVINYVRAGGRLPIALNCPSPLYQLMLRCWSAADARPNFKFCLENIIALRKNIEDTLLNPVDTI